MEKIHILRFHWVNTNGGFCARSFPKVDRCVDFNDGTGIVSNAWLPLLRTVLDNFVVLEKSGSSANLHLQFWDQIVFSSDRMCGQDEISGWLVYQCFHSSTKRVRDVKRVESKCSYMVPHWH